MMEATTAALKAGHLLTASTYHHILVNGNTSILQDSVQTALIESANAHIQETGANALLQQANGVNAMIHTNGGAAHHGFLQHNGSPALLQDGSGAILLHRNGTPLLASNGTHLLPSSGSPFLGGNGPHLLSNSGQHLIATGNGAHLLANNGASLLQSNGPSMMTDGERHALMQANNGNPMLGRSGPTTILTANGGQMIVPNSGASAIFNGGRPPIIPVSMVCQPSVFSNGSLSVTSGHQAMQSQSNPGVSLLPPPSPSPSPAPTQTSMGCVPMIGGHMLPPQSPGGPVQPSRPGSVMANTPPPTLSHPPQAGTPGPMTQTMSGSPITGLFLVAV